MPTLKNNCSDFNKVGCSLCPSHPIFRNVNGLKHHLRSVHSVSLCEICLEHKKVFILEQKLYNKLQLKQHLHEGCPEVDGVKGMSGFNGHPRCQFCNKFFYGSNELYSHMQQNHFWCDICKKREPNKFAYYSNYESLAKHFNEKHYPCQHPDCLEKKFVVFQSETELKRHVAKEHSGNVSRSQLREASRIPVNFTIRGAESSTPNESYTGHDQQGGNSSRRRMRGDVQLRSGIQTDNDNVSNGVLSLPGSTNDSNFHDDTPPVWDEAPTPAEAAGADNNPSNPTERQRHAHTVHPRADWGRGMSSRLQETSSTLSFPPLPGQERGNHNTHRRTNRPPPPSGYNARCDSTEGSSGQHSLGWADAPAMSVARRPASVAATAPTLTVARQIASAQTPQVIVRSQPSASNAWSQSVQPNGSTLSSSSKTPQQPTSLSNSLREANKALINDIRQLLGNNIEAFSSFRETSADYRAGRISSEQYHHHAVSIGLGDLVPKLAALLPDDEKRTELIILHSTWVLPSAAKMKAKRDNPSAPSSEILEAVWTCKSCSTVNSYSDFSCGTCYSPKAKPNSQKITEDQLSETQPVVGRIVSKESQEAPATESQRDRILNEDESLDTSNHTSVEESTAEQIQNGESAGKSGGRKKRGGRKPKFERLRLGEDHLEASDIDAPTNQQMQMGRGRVNPYNKWTQATGSSVLKS